MSEGAGSEASRPPPPHPGQTQGCHEVPHREVLSLQHGGGTVSLQNGMSGESHVFTVADVSLHFDSAGHAFTSERQCQAEQPVVRWVSSLLQWSAWRAPCGSHFIFRKLDDGFQSVWCDELMKDFQVHYVNFGMKEGGETLCTGKAYEFRVPKSKSGSCIFWGLGGFQNAVGYGHKGTDWLSSGLSRSWMKLLEGMQMGASDVILAHGMTLSEDLTLQRVSASTPACLLLLLSWGNGPHALQTPGGSMSATLVLTELLKASCMEHFSLDLFEDRGFQRGVQSRGLCHTLQVTSLVVTFTKSALSRHCKVSPEQGYQVGLVELLERLRGKSQLKWIFLQVLFGVADHLEQSFQQLGWPTDAFVHAASHTVGHRKDPVLRHALACKAASSRWARNGKRLVAAAAATGRQMQDAASYEKTWEMFLYWRNVQHEFRGSLLVAIAPDATRIGGRSRLCGPIMDLQSGLAAWMPPQALASHHTHPDLTFFCDKQVHKKGRPRRYQGYLLRSSLAKF